MSNRNRRAAGGCVATSWLAYLGVSKMTVWRLKHDEKYKKHNFPPASEINDLEFNDLDKIDAWMEARVAK